MVDAAGALSHVVAWNTVVEVQRARLEGHAVAEDETLAQIAPDYALSIFALACFDKAARLAARVSAAPELQAPLQRLRSAQGDLRSARDVLNHFDAYAVGKGHLLPKGTTSGLRQEISAQRMTFRLALRDRSYEVDLRATFDAARAFTEVAWRVISAGAAEPPSSGPQRRS